MPVKARHLPDYRAHRPDLPGAPTYRVKARDYSGSMEVEFFFDSAMATTFWGFWKTDLVEGGMWFNCVWPALKAGGLVVSFAAPPVFKHVYDGAYRVTATVYVRGASLPVAINDAEPLLFFGYKTGDIGNPFVVDGDPVTAHDDFLAAITGAGFLDFEAYTTTEAFAATTLGPFALTAGQAGNSLSFTSVSPGLVATFAVDDLGDGLGRYNTTPGGTNMLVMADNLLITFASPRSSFGCYLTDVGDFNGVVHITVTDSAGAHVYDPAFNYSGLGDASLAFWGIVNPRPITSISITSTVVSGSPDAIGIDDIIVGT